MLDTVRSETDGMSRGRVCTPDGVDEEFVGVGAGRDAEGEGELGDVCGKGRGGRHAVVQPAVEGGYKDYMTVCTGWVWPEESYCGTVIWGGCGLNRTRVGVGRWGVGWVATVAEMPVATGCCFAAEHFGVVGLLGGVFGLAAATGLLGRPRR